MKAMSAHDEKTLETAVALANEITSKYAYKITLLLECYFIHYLY